MHSDDAPIRQQEKRCNTGVIIAVVALSVERALSQRDDGNSEFHGQSDRFPSDSSSAVSPLDFRRTCERVRRTTRAAWNNIWFISRLVSENRRARSSGRASPSVPEGRAQKNTVFTKNFSSLHERACAVAKRLHFGSRRVGPIYTPY